MGGSVASKPVREATQDREPRRGTKSFEVISPCSDLSNPSDFNRVRYNRHAGQNQLSKGRPQQADNRKNSKSKKDYNPRNLPVAMQVRRSNSKEENDHDDIVAPGALYFPTKESERKADYLAKNELRTNYHRVTIKQIHGSRVNKGKTKSFPSLARRAAKKMKKKKDAMKRVAVAVGHACLEETRNKMILNTEIGLNATRQRRPTEAMDTSRRNMDKSGSLRSRRRSEQIAFGDMRATNHRHDVPLNKLKKDYDKKKINTKSRDNSAKNAELNRVTSAALHQADAYFERLSLSSNKNHGASPFVRHGDAIGSSNRVTSILESTSKKTPKDRKSRPSLDSPIDTPVSVLFGANDSVPKMRDHEFLTSSMKNNNVSPASTLMRFYSKTGPMESSPKSYCSDGDGTLGKMFVDEQSEESSQRRGIAGSSQKDSLGSHSQGSQSSLYTTESKSYKKANGKDLKLLTHDDQDLRYKALPSYARAEQRREKSRKTTSRKRKEEMPKVSKLESLFRPILPALSTDDAQSTYSYDPYEIKVTESAPGSMQPSNYVSLGFRSSTVQNENKSSPSTSVVSIDSQREPSFSPGVNMVSNQARHNGNFLFTDDYGPIVVARNPNKARDNATISISTAGSRSRLTQKSTQRGVAIPTKNLEKETDNMSFDSRSTRSERRVRFSANSVRGGELSDVQENSFHGSNFAADTVGQPRANMEERDESNDCQPFDECDDETKTVEAPRVRFATKPSKIKLHKFVSNVARINSVDESIDLPEIESKPSDMSESVSGASRKSLESVPSVRSHHSVPKSLEEEDDRTEVSRDSSVHWTKNKNGATPYVRGKSNAIPTKSPYFRYQDAKSKFTPQNHIVPKVNAQNIVAPEANAQNIVAPKASTQNFVLPKANLKKTKSPSKSPAKSPAKILRKGSGGLVSIRIQELNTRVSEVRKLQRMRKKMTNPRLHTHNFDNTQPVRSRALINYKTHIGSASIEKSNNVMAAKFNMIPNVEDDDVSIEYLNNCVVSPGKEDIEDDDVSRMSEITGATIATVRQQRLSRGCSVTSRTTASSGMTNLKKQVFRTSDGARSITSNCDSTTISEMMDKENENLQNRRPFGAKKTGVKPTMLVPPCQGTPAMKWRTLAAAAAEKDALKASSSKPRKKLGTRTSPRKGLGTRSINCENQYQIYGFKD